MKRPGITPISAPLPGRRSERAAFPPGIQLWEGFLWEEIKRKGCCGFQLWEGNSRVQPPGIRLRMKDPGPRSCAGDDRSAEQLRAGR